MILKKLSGKNGNERFSERYFHFFHQFLYFLCLLGLCFAVTTIDYTITIIIYSGESEAQTQQTQKMQNLMEKNENSAEKNARFHFFHSIFSKSKYMSHPFSISMYRKSKYAPVTLKYYMYFGMIWQNSCDVKT